MYKGYCPVCKKEVEVVEMKNYIFSCNECGICFRAVDKPIYEVEEKSKFYSINHLSLDNNIPICKAKAINLEHPTIANFNCFKTEEQAEKQAKKEALLRKLQAFSDANGADKIDWNDNNSVKYGIAWDSKQKKVFALNSRNIFCFGEIFFISEEVRDEAIKRYGKELEGVYESN